MGICRFKTSELRPLIEHAKAAAEFDMGYENITDEECAAAGLPPLATRTPKQPAILFVHDQGVYLMSNGIPRAGKDHVTYAEGCNPNVGEFDEWYSMSRELVGGDDFVEILPIGDDWLEECDACETFEIDISNDAFSYKFADVRPTAPPPPVIVKVPIEDLKLAARARKCAAKLGIETVYQLTQYSAEELSQMKNFGSGSLTEVRRKLACRGLTLKGDDVYTINKLFPAASAGQHT